MKNVIQLFDVVALLENIGNQRVGVGQVGTVVEILDEHVFEVEFCDNYGQTYAVLALRSDQLMPLRYSPQAA
ncbi:MAG: DUF4926 domain-containing protein [Desulfotignum sp.]|nr:DUF4926 domain-containing protein [Desulfotignum sp.]MCF8090708.1 DUF4926 domain-containing protein [Desulfotignum sp.]